MRIGIDYRFAARTNRGIGMYIRELVRELMLADKSNQYILYLDEDAEMHLPENFFKKVLPYKNILLFEQLYLPWQGRKDRLDILWYPSNSGPLILHRGIKLIITVHDMISFMDDNSADRWSFKAIKYRTGEYYRSFALRKGLNRIDRLLTVSEFSAAEIRKILNREAEIIPNNIRPVTDHDPDSQILNRLRIDTGEYFFTVTGDAPHKNLKGLLDIFCRLETDKKLVIGGVKDKGLIESYPDEFGKRVVITGYITEEEKVVLYKNACVFLFLSLYEGFGIPLLEAIQHHVPVIASNRSSIPGILGKGGILVDPENPDEVIAAIKNLVHYDKDKFTILQDEQLLKFSSWADSTRKLQDVFMNLSRGGTEN